MSLFDQIARRSSFSLALALATTGPVAATCSISTAERSVCVEFCNQTSYVMTLTGSNLDHGVWDKHPAGIPAGSCLSWQSESDGAGTQGDADFMLEGQGGVHVGWDNPFFGSNTYSCTAPAAFGCSWSGGSGNSAQVNFLMQQ